MGRTPATRAGILIPPPGDDTDRWISECLAIAEIEGWDVIDLVHTWEQMRDLLCGRAIDIGLIGRWAHLPPDPRPRLVVAEDYQPPPAPPGGDRPQRLRPRCEPW